jgi:hypothetical protein
MSRRFGFFITQREVHSWNPYSEEIVEAHNEVGVEVRYPGQRKKGKQPIEGEGRSRAERAELKLAAKVEQAHAKVIKATGNRFEVKDRDGHPRGYFPTLPPAQARADECGGFVTDRLEGLIVYSALGDTPDAIPETGEAEDWEMDW